MKTEHTPGPWTVAGNLIVSENDGVAIATVSLSESIDQHRSNARLIAAAPAMLTVLKRFMASYKPDIEEVIAQAESEEPQ